MRGIDVSYHQGTIDWGKVAKSGVEFAIIRAGYGKSTVDKKFIENIAGANTAGLKIGIYWFIYASNIKDAIANADMCDKTIRLYKDIIDLKVWADWEYDSDRVNPQTKDSRTAIVKAFCDRLKALGYEVGVYSNPDYLNTKFGDLSGYPLWLAWYSATEEQAREYNPLMFQHSSKGSVDGIKGNVDMNILYGEVAEKEPTYYPVPEFTLIDSLNKIGVDSSYKNRKQIAEANRILDYTGTAAQNLYMLGLLKSGKLIKQ